MTFKRYNDSRILGLTLDLEDENRLFLNVYLPAEGSGEDEDFMLYLRKLSYRIVDAEEENPCIYGDFIAHRALSVTWTW